MFAKTIKKMGIQTQEEIEKMKEERLKSFYEKIASHQRLKKEEFLRKNGFIYSTNEKEYAQGFEKIFDFRFKYPLKDDNNRKYRYKKEIMNFSNEEYKKLISDSYDPELELKKIQQIVIVAIALIVISIITITIISCGLLNKGETLLLFIIAIICINLSLRKI